MTFLRGEIAADLQVDYCQLFTKPFMNGIDTELGIDNNDRQPDEQTK